MKFNLNIPLKSSYFKRKFSIVELMTVILVIMLLISLLIPIFTNVKLNAQTALCKSNMHQISVLLTSYKSDSGGYFPNDNISDIPKIPYLGGYSPNNELYANWNGHLLPYLDVHLPDKYTRYAMVTKAGVTRYHHSQLGGEVNAPPPKEMSNGWAVIDDAYKIGGYQDLKIFICPEIHKNYYDVGASLKYNGLKIPRISQLCEGGIDGMFRDIGGSAFSYGEVHGMGGGVPTSYLANEDFFGKNWLSEKNSFRLDQIAEISSKALIIEGGLSAYSGYYYQDPMVGSTYFNFWRNGYEGGDLSSENIVDKSWDSIYKQKLSFIHENFEECWVMPGSISNNNYFPSPFWSRNESMELVNKFNTQFAPKAYMLEGEIRQYSGYAIVSYVDPQSITPSFDSFFKKFPGVIPLNPFKYYDAPEMKYLTGNMNVLFGDGSVSTKDQGWLYNNRRKISGLSNE